MAEQPNLPSPEAVIRSKDFISRYTNYIQFDARVLDVKIIFGQDDQREGKNIAELHTSMTMTWAEAKLLLLLLQIQVIVDEFQEGKINIPPSLLPNIPQPDQISDPNIRELFQVIHTKLAQILA